MGVLNNSSIFIPLPSLQVFLLDRLQSGNEGYAKPAPAVKTVQMGMLQLLMNKALLLIHFRLHKGLRLS